MENYKKMEDLVDHAREYVQVRVDEAKLSIAEQSSGVLSSLIATCATAVIFGVAFLFAGIAGALLIGDALKNPILGFLVMSGFIIFLGLLVWWGRERLIRIPIMNMILRGLLNDKDHEKN